MSTRNARPEGRRVRRQRPRGLRMMRPTAQVHHASVAEAAGVGKKGRTLGDTSILADTSVVETIRDNTGTAEE